MGGSRLDTIENKSDRGRAQGEKFFADVAERVSGARARAIKNNAWATSRILVNGDTGEVVTDKEGKTLSLGDMSKSWYCREGSRNNAYKAVARLKKAESFDCDFKLYRPKLISLTFEGESIVSWTAERAIQIFLDDLRHWLNRCGVTVYAYFWASEVQMKNGRGALHYHVLLLGAPFLPKQLLETWWSHGFADVRMCNDVRHGFLYVAKYLWKSGKIWDDTEVQEKGIAALPEWWFLFSVFHKRRFGFSKWFQLSIRERIPSWLRDQLAELDTLHICTKAARAVGGGWHLEFDDPEHNEHFECDIASPFKVVRGSV